MENIKFTASQSETINLIKTGKNVYLKGVAGTGKTFLLNSLSKIFPNKNVYLTASSGAAALNLNEGRTISSFLGLGKYDAATYTGYCRYNLNNSILVIDEIGLIGESQWEFVLKSIKKNSSRGKRPQIIIAGDPAQMPPIHWDNPMSKKQLKSFRKFELKEIVRQKDKDFIEQLMKLRKKTLTKKGLDFFVKNSGNKSKKGVRLMATRPLMDEFNNKIIEKNKKKVKINHDLSEIRDPDKPYNTLGLFEKMRVLITRNKYNYGTPVYINGDTGIIEEIDTSDDSVLVRLDRNNEKVWVFKAQNEFSETVQYTDEKGNILKKEQYHTYSYYPLLPAYALSVRRAQGLTLTKGIIDKSIIESNDRAVQYTALSRFKKIKGIFLNF